jgi:uncharacterized DUF497 family protein
VDKKLDIFVWDAQKELLNVRKHGVDFLTASKVFSDIKRKVYVDAKHTDGEERFFCIGKVGETVITVRFTYRYGKIRIFGAGKWRKGRTYYEKEDY